MKKYKLIKSFPGSTEVGYIYTEYGGRYYPHGRTSDNFSAQQVESNPEFFAPYLFTTEDGVEIYKGEGAYAIKDFYIYYHIYYFPKDYKCFSIREAAEAYLESLKLRLQELQVQPVTDIVSVSVEGYIESIRQIEFNTVEINYKR